MCLVFHSTSSSSSSSFGCFDAFQAAIKKALKPIMGVHIALKY
jgi:hypothetical protein